jgi:hypothetical protein
MEAGMKWKHFLLAGVGVAVSLFAYGTLVTTGGRSYFSPDTLETRTQAESHLLWWGFRYHRYALAEYLIGKGHWSPVTAQEPRWIETFHWNDQWRDGQSVLHKEFAWRAQDWIDWSETNPALAAVLWPRVLAALRSEDPERRHRATDMMFLARGAKDAPEFERTLAEEVLGK